MWESKMFSPSHLVSWCFKNLPGNGVPLTDKSVAKMLKTEIEKKKKKKWNTDVTCTASPCIFYVLTADGKHFQGRC